MKIINTEIKDLPAVSCLYSQARRYMAAHGNPDQWGRQRPARAKIAADIKDRVHYCCWDDDNNLAAAFTFRPGPDPTYAVIDGSWLDDGPYYVIHSFAVAFHHHGIGSFCLNWALENSGNIRIDTHRRNEPMRRLLVQTGFVYCGIIITDNSTPRLAYQCKTAGKSGEGRPNTND